jgi:hypothetical protein
MSTPLAFMDTETTGLHPERRACGVKPPTEQERHTALGDTRWAMRLYDAVVHGKRTEKVPA